MLGITPFKGRTSRGNNLGGGDISQLVPGFWLPGPLGPLTRPWRLPGSPCQLFFSQPVLGRGPGFQALVGPTGAMGTVTPVPKVPAAARGYLRLGGPESSSQRKLREDADAAGRRSVGGWW